MVPLSKGVPKSGFTVSEEEVNEQEVVTEEVKPIIRSPEQPRKITAVSETIESKMKQVWNPKSRRFESVEVSETPESSKLISEEKISSKVNVTAPVQTMKATKDVLDVDQTANTSSILKSDKNKEIANESTFVSRKLETVTELRLDENQKPDEIVRLPKSEKLATNEKFPYTFFETKFRLDENQKPDEIVRLPKSEKLATNEKSPESTLSTEILKNPTVEEMDVFDEGEIKHEPVKKSKKKVMQISSKEAKEPQSLATETIITTQQQVEEKNYGNRFADNLQTKVEEIASEELLQAGKAYEPLVTSKTETITKVKKTKRTWNPNTRKVDEVVVETTNVTKDAKPILNEQHTKIKSNLATTMPAVGESVIQEHKISEEKEREMHVKNEPKLQVHDDVLLKESKTATIDVEGISITKQIEARTDEKTIFSVQDKLVSTDKDVLDIQTITKQKVKKTWNPKTRKFDEVLTETKTPKPEVIKTKQNEKKFKKSEEPLKLDINVEMKTFSGPDSPAHKAQELKTNEDGMLSTEKGVTETQQVSESTFDVETREKTVPNVSTTRGKAPKIDILQQREAIEIPEQIVKDRESLHLKTFKKLIDETINVSSKFEKQADDIQTPKIEEVISFPNNKQEVTAKSTDIFTNSKSDREAKDLKPEVKKPDNIWNPKSRKFEEKLDVKEILPSKTNLESTNIKTTSIQQTTTDEKLKMAWNPKTKAFDKVNVEQKESIEERVSSPSSQTVQKPVCDSKPLLNLVTQKESANLVSSQDTSRCPTTTETKHTIVKRDSFKENIEQPIFLKSLRSIETEVGEPAVFSCQIEGKPAPDIKWYVGNKLIEPPCGNYTLIDDDDENTYSLVIETPSLEDNKKRVRCAITNVVGSADSTAMLTVRGGKCWNELIMYTILYSN